MLAISKESMNHKTTKRFSARFAAAVTVFSLIASAFPAPFSLPVAEAATQEVLFEDGFETDDFSEWLNNSGTWDTVSSSGASEGGVFARSTGDNTASTTAGSNVLTLQADTSGYENIQLTYYYRDSEIEELDGTTDNAGVEYSAKENSSIPPSYGSAIKNHQDGQESDWTQAVVDFPADADDKGDLRVRFTSRLDSESGDKFEIDSVKITGEPISSCEVTNGSDTYTSIQDAIDDASDDDTLVVTDGSVCEGFTTNVDNLTINPETIHGATISDEPSGSDRIVDIRSNGVTIDGFVIKSENIGDGVGISISGDGAEPAKATITNNDISQTLTGIQTTTAHDSGNNTITDNVINSETVGISLQNDGNTVENNHVEAGVESLGLLVTGNTIENNNFLSDATDAKMYGEEGTPIATLNWWGDETGPDDVTDVTVDPWLCGPFEDDPDTSVDGNCDPEGTLGSEKEPHDGKVRICSATASGDNPYVNHEVAINSITGPGQGSGGVNEGDIIPPFWYEGTGNNSGIHFYEGNNWEGDNIELWENDCGDDGQDNPEVPWCSFAGEVVDYTADDDAKTNGGNPVNPDRRNIEAVETIAPYQNIGGKEGSNWQVDPLDFFSLGIEGYIIYEFTGSVAHDQPGDDIAIYEITGGDSGQTNEKARILISQDGVTYHEVETITGDGSIDIDGYGLDYVKYVKLIDDSAGIQGKNGDGYDVDAIVILDGSCGDEPEAYQCTPDEVLHLDVENNSKQAPILHGVNTANGALTQLAMYDTPMFDLAVDKDGNIYATTRGGNSDAYTNELVILKLDGTTDSVGATGLVDEEDKTVAMGFAYDGTLYALGNHSNKLYELDTTTGDATELHDFSGTINVQGGDLVVNGNGDIVYVHKEGLVYTIDPNTFAVTNGGDLSDSHYTSLALVGDTYYAMERNSDKFATFELDGSNNVMNDSYSTGGNFMFGDGGSCVVEPEEDREASLVITDTNEDGKVLSGTHTFKAEYNDDDEQEDDIAWAIRAGTCDMDAEAVMAGNVAGFNDPSSFNAPDFSTTVDMSSWDDGEYCLVVNPDEQGGEPDLRETRTFTLENPDEQIACVPGENLLANADFEEPVVEHSDDWNIFTEGIAWLVDWVNPSGAPETASLELHAGVNGWDASEGNQYTELDGDWQGPGGSNGEAASVEISQDIPTAKGETYQLSWDFSPRPGTVGTNNELEVLVDGAPVASNSDTASGNTDWRSDSIEFTGTGEPTTIAFRDAGDSDSLGTFLDNTSLTCQPEPTAGPYCGDGEVNQEWEQCEVGDDNCTNYCMADNQCHTERLAKIDLDDSQESVSFNGKIYLGTSTNPIPNGTWFNLDETGDALANQIANEVDGLAVERNQNGSTTLRLAYRGGNSSGEIDYVQGDIEFLGAETYPGGVDEYVMGANSYDLEDGTNGSYDDVFDASDLNQVDFDMRADTGDDGVTMKIRDGEEYGQCEIGEGDGNGENGDEDLYEVTGFVWEDDNENGDRDGDEQNRGAGITMRATNQETDEVATTTTNSDGHYSFYLPEGTWIITQDTDSDWEVTYPDTEGNSYVVTLPDDGQASVGFFSTIARIFTPVAHAAETHEDYITGRNFGNVFTGSEGSDNGTDRSASTQSTGRGGGPMLSLSSNSDGVDEVDEETDDLEGRTLGEQTTRVPEGAPDAGKGGAAGSTDWVTVLWALAALGAVYLWLRKEDVHVQSRN